MKENEIYIYDKYDEYRRDLLSYLKFMQQYIKINSNSEKNFKVNISFDAKQLDIIIELLEKALIKENG